MKYSTVPKFMTNINFVREYPVIDVLTNQMAKKNVSIIVDTLGGFDDDTNRYAEAFRVVSIYPQYLISDKYKKLIGEMDNHILINSIISFGIVFFLLIVGLVVIMRFASKIVTHLNETIEVADKVERGEALYRDKDDANKNMNYEIL